MVNLRAKEAEHAALMFQKQKGLDEARGEEKFFDAQEFSSSNKDVANILEQSKVKLEEAAWGGDDDELDIDDEINAANTVDATEIE
jgi:hypothetical protein